ncbi:MAG: cyclic nucleotide-binding domain-containing protein [Ghiorsea sp.]
MTETLEDIRNLPAGTVLLNEGQQGEGVFIILSGQVTVTRKSKDNQNILLAELGEGQVFGEMSLIDHSPCSATITAINEVKVRVLNKEQFFSRMQSDISSVQKVMDILFQRMRAMNMRVVDLESQLSGPTSDTPVIRSDSVLIKGLTEPAKHAIYDMNSMVIDEFPYKIGRWSKHKSKRSWFSNQDIRNHIEIHDIPPYVVSRQHCQIEEKNGALYLSDNCSQLGTWVNGERISHKTSQKTQLNSGVNTIFVGDRESQFAFEIIVP